MAFCDILVQASRRKIFVSMNALRHGGTAGGKRTRAYAVWCSMHMRCRDKKDKWYGSKGIKVCRKWHRFENFLYDMGDPPSSVHQLDRKHNCKGYSPSNCRWATPSENALNRSTTRWIKHKGKTRSLSQWAEFLGLSVRTLKARIDYLGWDLDKALTRRKYK